MTIDFKSVFHVELDEVRKRRGEDDASNSGLPPLEERLDETSETLREVLDALDNSEQNDAWVFDQNKIRADSGGENNHPEAEKPRNYFLHSGLVGLAFSGGGIRSATFNLGVLQALEKIGLLKSIDYLSTVSGGGYLGSCLSSLYTSARKPAPGWVSRQFGVVSNTLKGWVSSLPGEQSNGEGDEKEFEFPFAHQQGELEPAAFRHLRNNANYLAPKGFLDLLRLPAILLRGVLVNFMVILPYILFASIVTVALWNETVFIGPEFNGPDENKLIQLALPLFSESSFPYSLILLSLLMAAYGLFPLILWLSQKVNFFGKPVWEVRNVTGKLLGVLIAFTGVVAFLELQPLAIQWLHEFSGNGNGMDWGEWLATFGAAGTVLASLSAGKLAERISTLLGKIILFFIGALGFLLFWALYLNLCRWAVFSKTVENATAPDWLLSLINFVPDGVLSFIIRVENPDLTMKIYAVYIIVAVTLWLYSQVFVDVNSTSLHDFYRDRLSKAYLIRLGESGRPEHNDTQKLSNLNSAAAPYHLINAAINFKMPKEAHRRGRQADTFVFSKLFIGGPMTGYCNTRDMESTRPHVDLGCAMAISGAAFAATAGKATIKPLVFLMAMLNVRLNYWLPNPKSVDKHKWLANNPWSRAGPVYLLFELFGWLDTDSSNVDISDGGHFENLGVYELLRRECRLIIAGDGECDPELKFDGVSELVRLAQIDMGIKIEIEGLDEIRAGKQHYAIGTIHYSNGREGKLIYLKSSLLKDDALEASLPSKEAYLTSRKRKDDRQYDSNPYIAHYKAKNPDFPHQTTADQFFDEKQFECYRALGYLVTMRSIG